MQQHIEETTPSFTRRTVMKAAGMATVGFGAIAAGAGTAAASLGCDKCVDFGKIEGQPEDGKIYTFTKGNETWRVKVTIDSEDDVEDGEVVRFHWRVLPPENGDTCLDVGETGIDSRRPVCRIDVKGGPGTNYVNKCSGEYAGYAAAPKHDKNENREFYAISNFRFYFCFDETTDGVTDCADDFDGITCNEPSITRPEKSRGPKK